MVNREEFSKRLQIIFDYYELTASAFAEKIEVGKASISHLLSGRNNPSLDFVLRVVKHFPEVELYWLLNGKGTFPKTDPKKRDASTTLTKPQVVTTNTTADSKASPTQLTLDNMLANNKTQDSIEIERIVIFYKNGTFKSYESK